VEYTAEVLQIPEDCDHSSGVWSSVRQGAFTSYVRTVWMTVVITRCHPGWYRTVLREAWRSRSLPLHRERTLWAQAD